MSWKFRPPRAGGAGQQSELRSALGQKQTSKHVQSMSTLPPKADIGTQSWNVRFVPKADKVRRSNSRQPLVQVMTDFRQ
jgi:hypothetical protein